MVVGGDIPTQLSTQLSHRLESSPMDDVGLQRVKERFHVGVLIRGSTTSHALSHAVLGESLAQWRGYELAAAIAMKDQSSFRAAARYHQRLPTDRYVTSLTQIWFGAVARDRRTRFGC